MSKRYSEFLELHAVLQGRGAPRSVTNGDLVPKKKLIGKRSDKVNNKGPGNATQSNVAPPPRPVFVQLSKAAAAVLLLLQVVAARSHLLSNWIKHLIEQYAARHLALALATWPMPWPHALRPLDWTWTSGALQLSRPQSLRFGMPPELEPELEQRAVQAALGEDFGVKPGRLEQMCQLVQKAKELKGNNDPGYRRLAVKSVSDHPSDRTLSACATHALPSGFKGP